MAASMRTMHGFKRALTLAAILSPALTGVAMAQTGYAPPPDTVTWAVLAASTESVKQGARATVSLQGVVQEGWHVYALEQQPDGPTPLRVALDPSDVAITDGSLTATQPVKFHDKAFGFDTNFYTEPFTVKVPVRIGSGVAPGPQQIPISVRFQTCNGPTCRPPKTVHLTAKINVVAAK